MTLSTARTELNGLIREVPQAFLGDEFALGNAGAINLFSAARTLKERTVGSVGRALWILFASVGLVLAIACANVANLFLVRSEARQRELAVRRALGAGRLGIARYFLSESALLAVAGGLIGLALAWGSVRLLVTLGPVNLPRLAEIHLDGVSVAFTAALSVVAALAFGAIPLWRGHTAHASLHDGGRGTTASRGSHRTRQLLMGGQVALALVLLVSSGLMARSFQKLRALDPGFDAKSALTFSIALQGRDYPTRETAVSTHRAILDRLSSLPGVTAVSASTCPPLIGRCFGNTVLVRGRAVRPGTVPPLADFRAIADGYFTAMGIRVVRGRHLDRGDVDRRAPVVVANQAFVDRFFPNQDPIGEHVASNRRWRESGQSARAFAQEQGVTPWTLYYWRKRLAGKAATVEATEAASVVTCATRAGACRDERRRGEPGATWRSSWRAAIGRHRDRQDVSHVDLAETELPPSALARWPHDDAPCPGHAICCIGNADRGLDFPGERRVVDAPHQDLEWVTHQVLFKATIGCVHRKRLLWARTRARQVPAGQRMSDH